MDEVIIIGAGGHAKVIIDILRSARDYEPIGCTDVVTKQNDVLGVSFLGDDSVLPGLYKKGIKYAFVAVGDNTSRAALEQQVRDIGFELVNAISPYSYVSKSAMLGRGVAIMPGVVINPEAKVGDCAVINTSATIDHDCVIESCCHIAPGCNIAGRVRIGKGSFLGVGCSVIPNVHIGEWSVIGAGAVVIGDLPAYSMALGVPARVVKRLREGMRQ